MNILHVSGFNAQFTKTPQFGVWWNPTTWANDRRQAELKILNALSDLPAGQSIYGFDLVRSLNSNTAAVYPPLGRLEKKGWVSAWFEDGPAPRRRFYQITDLGRSELQKMPQLAVARVNSLQPAY